MEAFKSDIEVIMSHQKDNNFKLWATSDMKLFKGAPFTTLECPLYLLDLKLPITNAIYQKISDFIFNNWKNDGRIRISPQGAIYPCHVALALKTLCYLGCLQDNRLMKTLAYFIEIQQTDGGWKCNKYSFGHGEETNYSTPNTTLIVLDCMRFFDFPNKNLITRNAIEFLLKHWDIKKPISPCHYGIGTLFMQVEYPFRGYNLFYFLYVLSFYEEAITDKRFLEAYQILENKVVNNEIIIERVVPKLSKLSSYRKGQPSILATAKYNEIRKNVNKKNSKR